MVNSTYEENGSHSQGEVNKLFIHLITRLSPSPPKLNTAMFLLSHSVTMYFHLCIRLKALKTYYLFTIMLTERREIIVQWPCHIDISILCYSVTLKHCLCCSKWWSYKSISFRQSIQWRRKAGRLGGLSVAVLRVPVQCAKRTQSMLSF